MKKINTTLKRRVSTICVVFFLSTLSVSSLYFFSVDYNKRSNNFIRQFPPHPVLTSKTIDLKYNSFYIAGGNANTTYLGNFTTPLSFFKINNEFPNLIRYNINSTEKLKISNSSIIIDTPYFYILDREKYKIFSGGLNSLKANKFRSDSAFFAEAIPISASSITLRTIKKDAFEYVLAKQVNYPASFVQARNLLQKQIDGLFCVDGNLSYNKELKQLIYVYHYRNQFICMDTNLNLIYRGKTIDTISQAKIKVAKIPSQKAITMSSPPLMVNKEGCVFNKWLFVNSSLKADNEAQKTFKEASVIDVYDILNGKYLFSFYLFDKNGKKMQSFRVFGSKLLALYDHYLMYYNLNPLYFK